MTNFKSLSCLVMGGWVGGWVAGWEEIYFLGCLRVHFIIGHASRGRKNRRNVPPFKWEEEEEDERTENVSPYYKGRRRRGEETDDRTGGAV